MFFSNSWPDPNSLPLSMPDVEDCPLSGTALLHSSYYNKGSAFTAQERSTFGLHGLLPPNLQTLEEQVRRAYEQYSSRPDALAKNTFMASMKEQNEVLYYKLIQDHLKEMFSVIYTPTEGDAIQNFSRLFRKPVGCFLNIADVARVEESLSKWGGKDDIDYIVVSDGGEILGIGDQGVGGILISVAKLVLATLCAGIHPARTLPVILDCGTDNENLLNDDLYLGLQQHRVQGERYDHFVDTFVQTAHKLFPKAYIHFEDFGISNARRILERYQSQLACFNDDIQGTGCVTLAAIMAALHVSKLSMSDMRMVVFGAGTAGTGIADQVRDAIATETGKSKEDASKQIWLVDKSGLLTISSSLNAAQNSYACSESNSPSDLLSTIKAVKPHVLIGTSTKPGSFTEEIVREMAKHVDRPIIFPLSNPTRLHEAVPKDLYAWTDGKVLCATGSPFDAVDWKDEKFEIAECNNSTVFPGIALGCILSRATRLTTPLLVAATKALAAQGPALQDPKKALLPDIQEVRGISVKIASAVIRAAEREGLVGEGVEIPESEGDEGRLEEWVKAQMWEPRYREYRRV